MVSVVILTHGEFGAYLLDAAEDIVGISRSQPVIAVKISGRLPLLEVRAKITQALEQAQGLSGGDGVLVLCDMLGGTPCNEALLAARAKPNIEILSGVNLYMAVSALMNSRRLGLAVLVEKVLADAKRAVTNPKALFYAKQKA